MNKFCLFVNLLAGLFLSGVALGDRADNGIECTVKLENDVVDVRDRLPDFKVVFTNKGEKPVRLLDEIYSPPDKKPHFIDIRLWSQKGGKNEKEVGTYRGCFQIGFVGEISFVTLNPGEKHEVPIKDVYLLVDFNPRTLRLSKGEIYSLEVEVLDERGDPNVRRKYKGKTRLMTI